ncbi:lipopolysaccharide biosynthesis protein [Microbacterium allomyrinae]|uniref:Lipopolysaccharide biosynthesis protein n=1 Tax=Microbacterium allomyrinae TaxID=2830666 RepID=A0A9X1S3S5_9MICO|nr:lipopolysaccharide biosynthesis protein [Microbacterium allomyrinae]MCC2034031.1 lipopolysaccharide biosynthesis protein [Microbacterium allomyrinae]
MSAHQNLGHRASRGIMVTMGGMWGRALLQMLSTMVLARLLTDADFGLMAMVGAIMGVAELVRDFGMTGAIIQAQNLSERVWKSLLWISALIGMLLSVAVALSAPLVAALYNEPKLVGITLVMAPGVFLSGLAAPLQAMATKQLRFSMLATLDIVTMAAGVAAGVITAILGWGFWSLVAMAGANFLVRLVVLWVLVRPKWGPPRIVREAWTLLGTGGSIFGAELLGYAEKNLDNVIIGAQLGPAALGQYSRAYALFLLPLQQMNGPLGRVALPVLSSLRDDGARYRRYIRSAALAIGYLTLPTYAIAAGVAEPLVLVLLGPGWDTAALLFSLLAIAGFAQAIGRLRTWLYISLGHSHRQFVYDLVARPIVIAGYFFGLWWGGLPGLVITYGVLSLVLLIPGFAFAMRGTFVRPGDVFAPIVRPFFMALFAFGGAYVASHLLAGTFALVQVLAGGIAALVVVSPLFLIPGYRRDIEQMIDFVKKVRKPKRAPTADAGEADADELAPATPAEIAAELATLETFSETVTDEQRLDEDELVRTEELTRRKLRDQRNGVRQNAGPGTDA